MTSAGTPQALLRERDQRERLLPGLDDTDWTMLLILWSGKHRYTVSNLCGGSHAPYTTALRHLVQLERRGFIERSDDQIDLRRVFVSLTILAREKLEKYAAAIEPQRLAA